MANTVIVLKKSATPSSVPSNLANGELAINYADGKLYYKAANGTIASISGNEPNYFGTVNANNTLVVADTPGDIFTIAAGKNIDIAGDAVNDKLTISLTDDVAVPGLLSVTASSGDEGGEIRLANAVTNSLLAGPVNIDIYQNQLRFFVSGGDARGAFINLAATSAGVGTDLLATSSGADAYARTTANQAFDKANAALPNVSGAWFNGTLTASQNLVADKIISTNNGNGENFKIGDDVWIGDYNAANALRIKGQQNASIAYINFGIDDTKTLGRSGTGPLTYDGNTIWHAGNDGAGTGLDADLLDGQHGSYYGIATDVTAANRVANAAFLHANSGYAFANSITITANLAFAHANAAFANANTVMISAQAAFTIANSSFLHANSGYAFANSIAITANLAFAHANAAFANGNTVIQTAQSAFRQANLAFIHANNAFASSNADYAFSNSAHTIANLAFTHANAAFTNANTVMISAQAAFTVANSSFLHANSGYAFANSIAITANLAFTHANAAFANGNTVIQTAQSAFTQANLAFIHANNAFASANAGQASGNAGQATANASYAFANSAHSIANLAFTHANAAFASSNADYAFSNSAHSIANLAFTHANNAYLQANAAASIANTKLAIAGGTITGNLSIVGSLTVSGNSYVIDGQTLRVSDPLIYLAGNNYVSDIVDIGFIGNYVNSTGQNVHTGLYREHENKEYYLFQGYDAEPINNHIGALSNNMTLAVLNADIKTSNLILGGVNAIATIGASFNHANAAHASANAGMAIANGAFASANAGQATANAAFNRANTANITADRAWNHANAAFITANIAFSNANTVMVSAQAAFTVANSGFLHANSGYAFANSITITANLAFAHANAAFANGNTVIQTAQSAFTVANAAFLHANAAFIKANAALPNTAGVSFVGTLYFPTGNVLVGRAVDSTVGAGVRLDVGGAANASNLLVNGNMVFTAANDGAGSNLDADLLDGQQGSYYGIATDVTAANRVANAAFLHANASYAFSNSAHSIANLAFTHANNAYIAANSARTVVNDTINDTRYIMFANGTSGTSSLNVAIGLAFNPSSNTLNINGALNAVTKSFVINHPTKDGMFLRYGSLEGPENGVYVRGRLDGQSIIELPNYWWNLIDEETITVNLTPVGRSQDLWVQSTSAYFIHLNQPADCFFTVFAERKDVDKLVVEY